MWIVNLRGTVKTGLFNIWNASFCEYYFQDWSKVLAAFCTNPKTELALLQKVQIYCYEDAKLMKHFRQIVQILYNSDVISESAILYWAEKGAKNQGKTVFLKQMEPFIHWLKTVESESEEE